jgi:hypothetical protein
MSQEYMQRVTCTDVCPSWQHQLRKGVTMQYIRATRRTNCALVFINLEHITAMQQESSENLHYTAIILHNGREIDVSEDIEDLLQSTHMVQR